MSSPACSSCCTINWVAGRGCAGRRTKLQDPTADGLVADVQASRGQQILEVAVAPGEPQIEPNRVTNDAGWEAVAS
jgi:hypothetical protein